MKVEGYMTVNILVWHNCKILIGYKKWSYALGVYTFC